MKVSELLFERLPQGDTDIFEICELPEGGRITILDRLTGWGCGQRDTETGYRDQDNKFWLASGQFDIRSFPDLTIPEAINKIKDNANTCVGV
jgi:hypothetical protein